MPTSRADFVGGILIVQVATQFQWDGRTAIVVVDGSVVRRRAVRCTGVLCVAKCQIMIVIVGGSAHVHTHPALGADLHHGIPYSSCPHRIDSIRLTRWHGFVTFRKRYDAVCLSNPHCDGVGYACPIAVNQPNRVFPLFTFHIVGGCVECVIFSIRVQPNGAYSICSDCRMRIGQLLEIIASIMGVKSVFKVDEKLWRPTDVAQVIDTTRIKALGWRPEIPIEKTIRDMAM